MEVRLLGTVEAVGDGGALALGGAKERTLLAALAIRPGESVSEDRLTDALWGDEPPATARKTLQSYVARLRKALGATDDVTIASRPGGYCLVVGTGVTDVAKVERLAVLAREAAESGDDEVAATALREALSHWRGPALGELASEPFALAEANRLDELRLALTEARVDAELRLGRHQALVPELEGLCANHPLREGLWAARMLALYRSGRQAEALRAYQEIHRHLGEELGLEPSPTIADLERAILRHDPALTGGLASVGGSGPARPSAPVAAALPSGVVTFLLTDVEGSTPMWETNATAMAQAMAGHDEILARAVSTHGGVLLKARGEGDSTFSVFARATDAAAAALAAQEALGAATWPVGADLRVRMAVHTGESLERDGDYFGTTVNRVARLRALAEGGQVLVSQSAAEVIVDHLGDLGVLVELGALELKGLTRPEQVYELLAPGATAVAFPVVTAPSPLPAALVAAEGAFFVGREAELARLDEAWRATLSGGRRGVFVSGEPGVGKTRLAAEIAHRAHADGATVLFGRCDEGMAVPYQPFVEALRPLIAATSPAGLRQRLGRRASDLARILPDIHDALPDLAPPTAGDAELERFLLFEAVVAMLAGLAADRPVVLVLDDVHWAATPTLLLLRHVMRAEAPMRLLVVATYRDTELDRAHPLADMLADLRRVPDAERVAVTGLGEADVVAFVAAAAGHDLDTRAREMARALYHETQGNPFFIGEVLAHLVESGAVFQDESGRWTSAPGVTPQELGLPEGVKEVVTRRLARLSEDANRTLAAASVIGARFSIGLLERVVDGVEVLDALDEATAAGLVVEVPGGYTFAHALVRQTLHGELSGPRRMRMHRRVGEALEAMPGAADVDGLARHFAEAALDGQVAKAADYALVAARQAIARLAYEDAVVIIERGLEAIELEQPPDLARRCDLFIALAEGLLAGGEDLSLGDKRATKQAALRAAEDARALGSGLRFARAAVAYGVRGGIGLPDPLVAAMCDEALGGLDGLPDDEPVLRAQLLTARARYHIWDEAGGVEYVDLAVEAVAAARHAEHAPTLIASLRTLSYALEGTAAVQRASEVVDEYIEVAGRTGNSLAAADGHMLRCVIQLKLADRKAAEHDLEAGRQIAEGLGRAVAEIPELEALLALLDGRWADAERLAAEGLAAAPNDVDTVTVYGGQLVSIHRERGTPEEMVPTLVELRGNLPGISAAADALLAVLFADMGQIDEASVLIEGLSSGGFAPVVTGAGAQMTLCWLADAVGTLDGAEYASDIAAHLRPHQGLLVQAGYIAILGAVDRYLGILATLMGDLDEAESLFEHALEAELRIDSPPLLARTRYWYARMLLRRDRPGDRARAVALLGECIATAEALEMALLARQARALLRPPLPRALAPTAFFVGRDHELTRLMVEWNAAKQGDRRCVLLAGEPGIGKTRLAAEVSRRAHADGALVLFGRCNEDMGVAYQPFVEALRGLVAMTPRAALAAQLGRHISELARVLPELTEALPDLRPPITGEPETERYLLFEAVVALLATTGTPRPIVLVLDDLHWAAKPTLLLLRHLLQTETQLPLLVVGTYRDTELDRAHPLAEALADLRRVQGVERVGVGGLDADGVAAFVGAAAGHDLDEQAQELAAALHTETRGNPFFVGEVLAHLADTGAVYLDESGRWTAPPGTTSKDLGLPEGVREVITRRLGRLSASANQVLTAASVVGTEFSLSLLDAVVDGADIINALDEALASGLVVEAPGGYMFAHALIRQTLYAELTGPRRMRLHRRVGEALEAMPARHLDALAHHFAEAALDGQEAKAVQYSLAAARQEVDSLAYEQAILLAERGIEVISLGATPGHSGLADLLLVLARAQDAAGDVVGWRQAATRAAQEAIALGSPERVVAACALYVGYHSLVQEDRSTYFPMLEAALVGLDANDDVSRSKAHAALAHQLELEGADPSETGDHARLALGHARRCGDRVALVHAFHVVGFTLDAEPAARVAVLDEQVKLDLGGAGERAVARLELGDIAGFRDDLATVERSGAERRHWWDIGVGCALRGLEALLEGRFGDVEALAVACEAAAPQDDSLRISAHAQRVMARREEGDSAPLRDLVVEAFALFPHVTTYRGVLALAHADLGEDDKARELITGFLAADAASLARTVGGRVTLACLSEAAIVVGHVEAFDDLYAALHPYAGQLVAASHIACIGAVDRFLGMLASADGAHTDAEAHFRAAMELEERVGARPLVARTRYWFARMLLQRDTSGDRAEAFALLEDCASTATELGMASIERQAHRLMRPPLPAPLHASAGAFFVGRDREFDRFTDAWSAVTRGERRCLLLAGEPGIGKTRLTAEMTRRAYDDSAVVLFGRCDEGLGVPFQPFVEALRRWVAATPPATVAARLGRHATRLARIIPDLAGDEASAADPETERYLLFESVVAALAAISADGPVVLVLDDLHWAAKPTLLMLRHVLTAETHPPLLLLGTYRDTELDRTHPLSEVLGDLHRVASVDRVAIPGLDADGVVAFVTAAAGHDLDERACELAMAIHRETEGNPFFMGEVLAHLVETGAVYVDDDGRWTAPPGVSSADIGLPEGVKEVITRRLNLLPDLSNRALAVASVIGHNFSLALLERVLPDVDVLDAVDAAVGAGLVVGQPGGYAFVHALVRQTLYAELTAPRRMRLHRLVGEAIESLPDADTRLEDLAHHFGEATLDGQVAKAAGYALAAARRALDHVAHEDAITNARRGLAALELGDAADLSLKADLLLAVSRASYQSGDTSTQHRAALDAAEDARAIGSADRLGEAAVAYALALSAAKRDPDLVALCEGALAALGPGNLALRAQVQALYAWYRAWSEGEGVEAEPRAREALEWARAAGEWRALAAALDSMTFVLAGSGRAEEHLAYAEELCALGLAHGDRWTHVRGLMDRSNARLELGDLAGFDADLAEWTALNSDKKHSGSGEYHVPMRAIFGGRYVDAEALIESFGSSARGYPNKAEIMAILLIGLRREQGRLGEIAPLVEGLFDSVPEARSSLLGVFALIQLEMGNADAARAAVCEAVDTIALIPRDHMWTLTLACLSEVSAALGDAERAAALWEEFRFHRGHLVVPGQGVLCFGSVDRYRGMLAMSMGEWSEAEACFEAAAELEERIDVPPSLARTRLWYGRMLIARGEHERASAFIRAALATAEELGMALVASECRSLLATDEAR